MAYVYYEAGKQYALFQMRTQTYKCTPQLIEMFVIQLIVLRNVYIHEYFRYPKYTIIYEPVSRIYNYIVF